MTVVEEKKTGDLFGEYNFFTGLESRYSVRSKGNSQIKFISRETFLQLIQSKSLELEIFNYIKDQLAFSFDSGQVKQ